MDKRLLLKSFLVTTSLIMSLALNHGVRADNVTVTTKNDWEAGTLVNLETESTNGEIQLKSAGSWGAISWKTPDKTISIGAAFASDGEYIYVLRGLGDIAFWRYYPPEDRWENLANAPRGAYFGADLQHLNGNIYAFFGGYQKAFAKYSVSSNQWEMLSDYPSFTWSGAAMTTDGTNLYGITGNTTQEFFRYNVVSNVWTPLAPTPATLGAGADITFINGDIYTLRGANTNTFYRYNIAAGTWATLTNAPATINEDIDTTTDGTNLFFSRQSSTTSFYRYNVATNNWTTLTNAPLASRYAGVQFLSSDGLIYFFRGNGGYQFWKYDVGNDQFIGPAEVPGTLAVGADMLYYNGHVYTLRGNSTTLYRYNTGTNSWETMASSPASFADDVRGVVAGNYLYFFRGGNTTTFYRYDPAGNSWDTLTNAPTAVRFGAGLAYPGSGDYIYATRGNTTTTFWRYQISTNSWVSTVADLPTGATSSYGSVLTSDNTYIYYIAGIGIKKMYRYTIDPNPANPGSWTELGTVPFSPYYGTDVAYANGKILAIAGWYKNDIYEYNISSNNWKRLNPIPTYGPTRIGAWQGASLVYDSDNNTFYSTLGGGRAELYAYTPGDITFEPNGLWTSQAYDLKYVSSWNNLTTVADTPSDTSLVIQTRTSLDGSSYTSWETVTGTDINSPANRYLQVRVQFIASTGNIYTPILKSVTVSYEGDITPPPNPVAVNGSSQQVGGTPLTSGQSYGHLYPFFSWSTPTDLHTTVDGYYVYFGSNASANPTDEGTYQTSTGFQSNIPFSTGTYYLRIATKDVVGNVSSPETLFEYVYNGVSPSQQVSVQNQGEFLGFTTNVEVSNGKVKLTGLDEGFWMEEGITNPPGTIQWGGKNAVYIESSNTLYLLQGSNSLAFYSYNPSTNLWTTLAPAPATVNFGGGLVEGPTGYLYASRGNGATDFWLYDIEANSWITSVSNFPLTTSYGSAMVFDGYQYIYATRGNGTNTFWRYDTSFDEWNTLAGVDFGAPNAAINNNIQRGADLVMDRTNGLIYSTQGNYRQGFSVYNTNTGAWTFLGDTPTLSYDGAALSYDNLTNHVYYTAGNTTTNFFKYDVANETWTQVSSTPATFLYGAGIHRAGRYIYAIRGGATSNVYKYDIDKDRWLMPTRGIFGTVFEGTNTTAANVASGGDIIKGDGNNFYLLRGNYSDDFIKWDSTTGTAERLANSPVGAFTGTTIVYDSSQNYVYLAGGIYDNNFYYYDISNNAWYTETSDPTPALSNTGSSMVYDGSRYIYLVRGGNTSNFYRFDTQGTAGNKWQSMANPPATLGIGSQLILKDDYIYTPRGNGNTTFYRYNILLNTWTTLETMPNSTNNDGFIVDGNDGYLYLVRGTNSQLLYKYSIQNNTWEQLSNTPANVSTGAGGDTDRINKMYMLSGAGTNSLADALYTYIFSNENSGFVNEGNYISQSHDLTSVYRWAELEVTLEKSNSTTTTIETRTSPDNLTWSDWTSVVQEKLVGSKYVYRINSPTNRYIQVRFSFRSNDGVLSPTLDGYRINYYQDSLAPSNPQSGGFEAYSDSGKTTTLNSTLWYSHSAPYFEWAAPETPNGASDTSTGSGVAGYYVYFGTTAGADPVAEGTLITNNYYSPGTVVSGDTNYLRIKTVDNAGNVSASTWDAFSYKFDNTAPPAPADLIADPAGYTSTNSFSFSWSEVTENSVPAAEYCYKTGASSGTYSTDQCITALTIAGIPAYRVGVNTFYVRAKDQAGNFSSYATVSYFYADASNAPAPPTNLTVTPVSNTSNSFAFSWDVPAVFLGSAANLSYRFSVNILPSATSTTSTSLRYVNAGAYATAPGENVFYIVAVDEAGNVNYSNYSQVSFFANTVAPGIPVDVEIADVSVKETSSWRLALSWDPPTNQGSGVHGYSVFRSTDGVEFTQVATTSSESYVDTRLQQIVYYYKIKACDNTQNCGEFSSTAALLPDGRFTSAAPLVSDPIVSEISTRKATVSWVTSRTSDSRIAYGTKPGTYFSEEVSSSEQVANHSLILNNLSPGTKYFLTAKWTDEDGNIGTAEEISFSTLPPPSTEEPTAKNVGLTSATIEFVTRNAASVRLYYGETPAFGGLKAVPTSTAETTNNVELTDLKDGTKYFYKINTLDVDGTEYEGEMHSFETLPRPEVTGVSVIQIQGTARTTLLVRWNSNTEVSSIVTYYPTAYPQLAIDEVNINVKSGTHSMVLFDLEPQTPYSIVIRGIDIAGNEAVSDIIQVVTSADTRPPQILELKVEAEIIGLGAEATSQIIVSFKTDEAANAQVEYGEGTGTAYSQKTQQSGVLTNNHLIVISGLSPGSVYHLRAIASDSAGNEGVSIDKVIVTPKASDNALDLVIKNLTGIFSFLGNVR